ncbi:acyltransferase [Pedobacter sp. MC2016-14]|uniref:acyltransferase family protein n=1 Tax=Pedobacter sp. MC2016-14 TaxID=2897327 RepID=UPI001E52007F|nr:acyltransferase [Pedobacter sp. MC2016-14]MCD0486854.1 acyltransferase [Pedobacter sp. MC2016-14]
MNEYLSVKLKVVSFFLMVMVVVLHANNLNNGTFGLDKSFSYFIQNFFSDGLARVTVPLFFLISGYLFFFNIKGTVQDFNYKISKRLKTLFIPYLFWSLWGLFVFFMLQTIPFSRSFINMSLIKDYPIKQLLTVIFLDPLPYQLWFVKDLMLLVILSPILFYLIKTLKYFVLIAFFVLWFLNYQFVVVNNESILFFSLGTYIGMEWKKVLLIKFGRQSFIFVGLWVSFVLCKELMIQFDYINPLLLNSLKKTGVLLGVFSSWALYDILFRDVDFQKSKHYPVFSFTFFLYAFHEPVLTIYKKALLSIVGKTESGTLIVYVLTILLTISTALTVAYLVKLIIPKFYELITGGR